MTIHKELKCLLYMMLFGFAGVFLALHGLDLLLSGHINHGEDEMAAGVASMVLSGVIFGYYIGTQVAAG